MSELTEDDYLPVGWYHVTEVPRLFKGLEEREIRFFFDTSDSGITALDPISARNGGSFGQGARVQVFVHPEDDPAFHQCYRDLFEPEPKPKPADWRKRLREPS